MDTEFDVDILYTQLAVFDAALQQPYNNWSPQHVKQGFAWRPQSVSFAMLDDGPVRVRARSLDTLPALPAEDAIRILRVPFQSLSGVIEIGSVALTEKIVFDREAYGLHLLLRPAPSDAYLAAVDLLFVKSGDHSPAILRQDSALAPTLPLLMQAEPA